MNQNTRIVFGTCSVRELIEKDQNGRQVPSYMPRGRKVLVMDGTVGVMDWRNLLQPKKKGLLSNSEDRKL